MTLAEFIVAGGEPSGYFAGHFRPCVMCGWIDMVGPTSGWVVVEYAGRAYYACPDELPPVVAGKMRAYRRILEAILRITE